MPEYILNTANGTVSDNKPISSNETKVEYVAKYKDPTIVKKASVTKIESFQKYTYTFDVKNNDTKAIDILFTDLIDATKTTYVTGSFKVAGVVKVPTSLVPITFNIPTVAGGATVVVTFEVEAI